MQIEWYLRNADSQRSSLPVVVFDGDDTLWATEALYDAARREAAQIVARTGLDPLTFESLQREIDVDNVAKLGLSRTRFPTSSREAYVTLASHAGHGADPSVAQAVYEASSRVFNVTAPLAPHVSETLLRLRDRYRLTILTKGDTAIQRKRVDDSGLSSLLDAACIVNEKDVRAFAELLRTIDAEPAAAWSVGNSYGSDVHPAVSIGMRAIWIDAHVWAHERSLSERVLQERDHNVFVADDMREVPAILESAPLRRPSW